MNDRMVLKTIKEKLYSKTRKKHSGNSSDDIRPGLPKETQERIGNAHREIRDGQANADHHDDHCCFRPVVCAPCQKNNRGERAGTGDQRKREGKNRYIARLLGVPPFPFIYRG
jgi:hypothetical protein